MADTIAADVSVFKKFIFSLPLPVLWFSFLKDFHQLVAMSIIFNHASIEI